MDPFVGVSKFTTQEDITQMVTRRNMKTLFLRKWRRGRQMRMYDTFPQFSVDYDEWTVELLDLTVQLRGYHIDMYLGGCGSESSDSEMDDVVSAFLKDCPMIDDIPEKLKNTSSFILIWMMNSLS